MSAIFGIYCKGGQQVSQIDLSHIDTALATFGPDGNGFWFNNAIGLGQRDLHITPEDRFQKPPLVSVDRRRVLVCDCRIDNRPELGQLLGHTRHNTQNIPDSAFIMQAYEKWGHKCARHLIGDFSFALWDQHKQRLILTRSMVGGRPLYYYSSQDSLYFSSMPQGLFALPHVPRELNLEYIAGYLTRTGTKANECFYNGISVLPPGHILIVNEQSTQVFPYWQMDTNAEIRFARDNDYVEAFIELFDRVISDHLRSAAPVGVMMSGGLDSTSVAAVAASQLKQKNQRLQTFTEVPRKGFEGNIISGRYADETPFIKEMARYYDNIDLNPVHTDGQSYLEGLDNLFNVCQMPFRNASNRVWYEAILQLASNKGIKVLLNGGQGNLTISRNGEGHIPQLLRSGNWKQALNEASALHRNYGTGSTLRTFVGQGVMPLLPTPLWALIQRMRGQLEKPQGRHPWKMYSPINPDFADSLRLDERAQKNKYQFSVLPDHNPKSTIVRLMPRLAAMTADLNQGYSSLYGVENRDPTGDIRIVEFCLSLPEEQFQKNGTTRRLIRRAMANRLPATILENRGRGLQAADWFERLQGAQSKILLTLDEWGSSSLVPSIIDIKRLYRLTERLPHCNADPQQQRRDYRTVLDTGLMIGSFVYWFEKSKIQRG